MTASKHGLVVESSGVCMCCAQPVNTIIDMAGLAAWVDRPADTLHTCLERNHAETERNGE